MPQQFLWKAVALSQTDFEYSSIFVIVEEDKAELLSTEDFLVIDALYHERPLNEKMQSRLNRLIEMGIVEHIGRKKYILARSLYAATGKTGVHTRHVGLDRDTNKELLLMEMSRNVQSGNTQNLKSTVIQRSFPKWSVAERRKTAAVPVRLPFAPAPVPGTSQAAVPAGCAYRS